MQTYTPKHIGCASMQICVPTKREKGRKDIILMKETGQRSSDYFANSAVFLSILFPRGLTGRKLQMTFLVCAGNKENIQEDNTTSYRQPMSQVKE